MQLLKNSDCMLDYLQPTKTEQTLLTFNNHMSLYHTLFPTASLTVSYDIDRYWIELAKTQTFRHKTVLSCIY